MYQVVMLSSYKNRALAPIPHFDINLRITFAFKLLANYECHDEITVVTIY